MNAQPPGPHVNHPPTPTLTATSPLSPAPPEIALPDVAAPVRSKGRVTALQRAIGNQATLRLLDEEQARHHPVAEPERASAPEMAAPTVDGNAPGDSIQRVLMPLSEWRTTTAVDDAGQPVTGPRSLRLRQIDNKLDRFNRRRGYVQYEFGFHALNELIAAIQAFVDNRSTASSRIGHVRTLQTAVNTEQAEVNEMRQIRDRLRDNFNIRLDNATGIDSIYRFYRSEGASRSVLRQLRESPWEATELRQIERALTIYSPLLGANRPGALGGQTIRTFSRLRADITTDMSAIEGTGGRGLSTFAETFTQRPGGRQLSNISMFDHAGSVMDFVADPAHPTAAELERGYRGTVVHELSHGLIEMLPNPPLPAPTTGGAAAPETFPNGRPVSNMIQHFANQMDFWLNTNTPSGIGGAEAPITDYGQTSANEDLAEALMFFFEDPARLQRQCPLRYAFIQEKLAQYLNPESVNTATQAAIAANPDLNPPPPPPASTAPGTAAPGPGTSDAAAGPGTSDAAAGPGTAEPPAPAGPSAEAAPGPGTPDAAVGPGTSDATAGPSTAEPPAPASEATVGPGTADAAAGPGTAEAAGPGTETAESDAMIQELIAEIDSILASLEENANTQPGGSDGAAAPEPAGSDT